MAINFLVLDILKPHKPGVIEYAQAIEKASRGAVSIKVLEIDEKTESVEATITGKNINFKRINEVITKLGGSVHSIDEVCVGSKTIRNPRQI